METMTLTKENSEVDLDKFDEVNFDKVDNVAEIVTETMKNFNQNGNVYGDSFSSEKNPFELEIEKEEIEPNIVSSERNENKVKSVNIVSIKDKLAIGVCSSILVFLSILLIYNFVLINGINAEISADSLYLQEQNEQIYVLNQNLTDVVNSYSKTAEGMGFSLSENNVVVLEQFNLGQAVTYSQQSNWFDSICEFISNIFGG